MRTNGFIFIALAFTAGALAGPPGYLPSVGPITLRFNHNPPTQVVKLPPLRPPDPPITETLPETEITKVPIAQPSDPVLETNPMTQNPPVVLPVAPTGSPTNTTIELIGPLMDNSGTIPPQMFLRFFTPPRGGVSRETVLVPPPGFNPAQPPPPSSTATYSQPKP